MNTMKLGTILSVALLALSMGHSLANPTGGQVAAGSATINTVPGTVTINQLSNIAIINWQTFSINAGELTKFVQPSSSSAALNRVLGGQTSVINGTLSANGQVYLINGNGIVVGPGGNILANTFVGSTRDISDTDFLSGNLHFTGSSSAGVENQGTISALGGDVYLIGKTVDNQGTINAANGTAGLASGDDVLLNLNGDEHVFVSPSPTASSAPSQTAVHNSGTIAAASAELKAANGNLFALAINNEGTVRATSVANVGGRIFLTADSGLVQNTGNLTAKSGKNGGTIKVSGGSVWNRQTIDASGAQGGSVTVNAQNLQNDGTVSVKGTAGAGGSVAVTYSGNALGSVTGVIDASGTTQGGSIQVLGTGLTSEAYLSLKLDVSSTSGAGGLIDVASPSLYLTGATLTADGATKGGFISLNGKTSGAAPQLAFAQLAYVDADSTITANATSAANDGQISTGEQTALSSGSTSGAPSFEFVDPNPGSNNQFGQPGTGIFSLASNNTLITSPGDSFASFESGAVYLFSNTDGALLSTLRGSHGEDAIGTTVQLLTGGNFAVVASNWNSNTGAVTFGNGVTGFANGGGTVSASNSLIGSTSGDTIGSGGLYQVFTGDYLVLSPNWNSNAGAVTWVDPALGLNGVVGAGNSLVGATAGDSIGSGGIRQLSNGANYLVLSPLWNGGMGAVTNGSNTQGVIGAVSAANSLVGASTGDGVGSDESILDSGLGYYLVKTPNWNGGAGAVTWNSDSLGTTGAVLAGNSLVGSASGDQIGSGGITILTQNDNFIVSSPNWSSQTGAVTLGNSSSGVTGVVSASNSLVGAAPGDMAGSGGITPLTGLESYAVSSPSWGSGAGAVSWGTDATGIAGVIGASNSLVGANAGDQIGSGGITNLANGTFLVLSPHFNTNAGAVTWEDSVTGPVGVVTSVNSLVGASAGDSIGSAGIIQLSESDDFFVLSPNWGGGAGAITNASGTTGISGTVSALNSLVGASTSDHVGSTGSIIDSFDGYYLVKTPNWGGGAGSITWSNDDAGTVGVISAANSLVGSSTSDHLGSGGVTTLYNNNFVVLSPQWSNNTGAITWGNGTTGLVGVVSAANSLVGAAAGDQVGSGGIYQLSNINNFLVLSPLWGGGKGAVTNASSTSEIFGVVSADNSLVGASTGDGVGADDSIVDPYSTYYLVTTPNWSGGAGAVTWNSDTNGTVGVVSAANSLVGSNGGFPGSTGPIGPLLVPANNDNVGSGGITVLNNGNYLVNSPAWNGNTGAVSFGTAASGVSGVVSGTNSLIGANAGDKIGSDGIEQLINGNYLVLSSNFGGGAGAVTFGDESLGVTGVVSGANSLVGSDEDDSIGSGGITFFSNSNYVVSSPNWNDQTGAVTFGNGSTGVSGVVSSANSLVGASTGDQIGSGGITQLSNGANFLVLSPNWNGGAGAITNETISSGATGVVSSENSLVGASSTDGVGSGGSIIDSNRGYYLVQTLGFGGGAGAVTWNSDAAGKTGEITSANSLVGSTPLDGYSALDGDRLGSGGITILPGGNYVVDSPSWDISSGAVTLGSANGGISGVVSASNSLVGGGGSDSIGSGGIKVLANGNFLVLSPDFGGTAGAVTFEQASTGLAGPVSADNSLVGANFSDDLGSGGIMLLSDGNYLVVTPNYRGGAGAVTWGSETTGITGALSATNSLLGKHLSDHIGSGGIVLLPNGNYLVLSNFYVDSSGAATWGSEATGITGYVSGANSIIGGQSSAGLQYAGLSSDDSLYLISFASDHSNGGDGRVFAGSVNGPYVTPAATTAQDFFMDQPVISFATTGFNHYDNPKQFNLVDPVSWNPDTVSVGTISGGALNDGSGNNLASGSSTSGLPGTQRLVTPGNGIWNIFNGVVHSTPPPGFVSGQLQFNLSPAVLNSLHDIVFGHP